MPVRQAVPEYKKGARVTPRVGAVADFTPGRLYVVDEVNVELGVFWLRNDEGVMTMEWPDDFEPWTPQMLGPRLLSLLRDHWGQALIYLAFLAYWWALLTEMTGANND